MNVLEFGRYPLVPRWERACEILRKSRWLPHVAGRHRIPRTSSDGASCLFPEARPAIGMSVASTLIRVVADGPAHALHRVVLSAPKSSHNQSHGGLGKYRQNWSDIRRGGVEPSSGAQDCSQHQDDRLVACCLPMTKTSRAC